MKRILFILVFLITSLLAYTQFVPTVISANVDGSSPPPPPPVADYFFASDGDDSNTGTATDQAWKTISKLNTEIANGTFQNKIVAFCRTDTFQGEITISGQDSITLSAYGTGAKPVISGLDTITGTWTVYNGNIWEVDLSGDPPNQVRYLAMEGTKRHISIYPNTGYLDVTAGNSSTQFTDTDLTSDNDYWNGAEVSILTQEWSLDCEQISDYNSTGDVITLASALSYTPVADHGYRFQNDTTCMDLEGEWAYDISGEKLYIYTGGDPNDSLIVIAQYGDLVDIDNASVISFENIKFEKSNGEALNINLSDNITLDSCEFEELFAATSSTNSSDLIYENNTLNNLYNNGFSGLTDTLVWIRDNTISNIAINPGESGERQHGNGINVSRIDGASIGTDSCFIYRNDINKVGYAGIRVGSGNNVYIDSNRVVIPGWTIGDVGGIYIWHCAAEYHGGDSFEGTWIRRNYVLVDTTDAPLLELMNASDYTTTTAMYPDDGCTDVTIEENIGVGGRFGTHIHNSYDVDIFDNFFVKCMDDGIHLDDDGISAYPVENVDMQRNVIEVTYDGGGVEMFPLNTFWSSSPNPHTGCTYDYNYYMIPKGSSATEEDVHYEWDSDVGAERFNITEWIAAEGGSHAEREPFSFTDSHLTDEDSLMLVVYNFSGSNIDAADSFWAGDYTFYDKDSTKITTRTLEPYQGEVFFVRYDVTPPDTANNFEVSSPARDTITLQMSNFATDVDTIRVNYKGGSYPSSISDGTLKFAFGAADTSDYADTTFFYDAAADTILYFAAWHGDEYENWCSVPNKDTVAVDSTGAVAGKDFFDDFEAIGDANDVATSSDWTAQTGVIMVRDDGTARVYGWSGNPDLYYWNEATSTSDQYAEVTLYGASSVYNGPAVRVSTTQTTAYVYEVRGINRRLMKYVNGTPTQLSGDTGAGASDGDVFTITVVGTTIKCYYNGALDTALGSGGIFTDSDISSGRVGMYSSGWSGASLCVDDWWGGDE